MKHKRILSALLAAAICLTSAQLNIAVSPTISLPAYAEELTYTKVTENGVIYNVQPDCAVVAGYEEDLPGNVVIPEKVNGVPVSSIGSSAFMYCHQIESITLPDSVIEINSNAFDYCQKLSSVNIPASVTSIGYNAFAECRSLKAVKIPASVNQIGSRVFSGCTSLESISVDSANQNYLSEDGVLFDHNKTILMAYPAKKSDTAYTIPDSVTTISDCAFYGNHDLVSITIPDGLHDIGAAAFEECYRLDRITLPLSVSYIGLQAFAYCVDLEELTILNDSCYISDDPYTIINNEHSEFGWIRTVTIRGYEGSTAQEYAEKYACNFEIAADSERGYAKVTEGALTFKVYPDHAELIECDKAASGEIAIPDEVNGVPVTILADQCFAFAEDVTAVIIPETVKIIGLAAFTGCSSLTSAVIPEGVTSIAPALFSECSRLESVTLPDSVTSIENNAFSYCTDLKAITLPAGVKKINDNTFYGCESLTDIVIPEGVTSIGYYAFANSGLVNVTIPGSVTNIDWLAFDSTPWIAARQEEDPFVIVNGMLIDGTACEGNVIVPDGVERIICNAFRKESEGFSNISAVTIPRSVASIEICLYGTAATEVTFLNSRIFIPEYFTEGSEITTFVGYDGSTAQAYAEEHGLTFISLGTEPEWLYGDVNSDDRFTVSDIVRLQKWLLAVPDTHLANWKAADFYMDGKLNVFDLCMMKRALIQQQN